MRQTITDMGSLLVALLVMALIPATAFSADLEQKVESLEKIVTQQQTQIDTLTKQKQSSVSPFKNDKVMVTLYGQLNRAILVVDDGNSTEYYNVDNDHSSTRFGLNGTAKAFDGMTLGTKVELEYQANASDKVNQLNQSGIDDKLTRRHLDVYINFDKFGKISLGHGDTASNGTSEVDLSGTSVIGYSSIADFSGGQYFYNSQTGIVDTGPNKTPTVGSVFDNLDGLSRKSRVRYDTPTFAGFTLSASAPSGEGHDFAARYKLDHDAFNLQAAVAYWKDDSRNKTTNGSASILLNAGLNFTVAGGSKDFDNKTDDGEFVYGKIGYIAKIFSIGNTAVSIETGEYKNFSPGNDKAVVSGVQFVQNVTDWNTELYIGYRNHDLDRANYKDVNAVMSGVRVKF